MIKLDFLRQLLDGRKKFLQTKNICWMGGFERYHQLKIEIVVPLSIKKYPELIDYFPNKPILKLIDREWSYNVPYLLIKVINTISKGWLEKKRIDIIKNNSNSQKNKNRDGVIELQKQFKDLFEHDLYPLSRGSRLLSRLEQFHSKKKG